MNYDYLKELLDKVDLSDGFDKTRPVRNAEANGTAWLQDGQVQVTDPGQSGKPATIKPGENVVLFINGKMVKEETPIVSEDEIEVYPESTPGGRTVNLSISESQLSARLKVTYTPKSIYKLVESGPDHNLKIYAIPDRFEVPQRYTTDELIEYLRDNGVVYGIDLEEVAQLAEEGGDTIVARGLPPALGTDAKIELLFPTEVFRYKEKCDAAVKVDILDQFDLVQVKPGDLLARKIPAVPGTPGRTVAGTPLEPPEPQDATVFIGDGARFSEDGQAVIATKAGLPRMKNNNIGVLPFYTHEGTLDSKYGHLNFSGHVVISGDVKGGVKLSATGDIMISGSVSDAEVVAGGNLTVRKSVISSNIKAGGQDAILSSLVTKLNTLCGEISLLARAINQLRSNPAFIRSGLDQVSIGQLVRLLLDRKFAHIPKQFSELDAICRKAAREDTRLQLAACAEKFASLNVLEFKNVQEIRLLKGLLQSKAKALAAEINSLANLNLAYAQNSTLQASGNIICSGKGCYDCELYAGGEVKVRGEEGYFRGRKIVSGGNVDVADLGCPFGQETIVEFSPHFKLRADIVRNNTVIITGRQSVRIEEDKRFLKCWVDYKGHLNVSTLSFRDTESSKESS